MTQTFNIQYYVPSLQQLTIECTKEELLEFLKNEEVTVENLSRTFVITEFTEVHQGDAEEETLVIFDPHKFNLDKPGVDEIWNAQEGFNELYDCTTPELEDSESQN